MNMINPKRTRIGIFATSEVFRASDGLEAAGLQCNLARELAEGIRRFAREHRAPTHVVVNLTGAAPAFLD